MPCLMHSSNARLFPSSLSVTVVEVLPTASYPAAPCCPSTAESCQDSWDEAGSLLAYLTSSPEPGLVTAFHFSPSSTRSWVWLGGSIRAVGAGADPTCLGAASPGPSCRTHGDSGLHCPSSSLSATCGMQMYIASFREAECTIAYMISWGCC